jgi:hypothetical protein
MKSEERIKSELKHWEDILAGKTERQSELKHKWEKQASRLWAYGLWHKNDIRKSHVPTVVKVLRWILE